MLVAACGSNAPASTTSATTATPATALASTSAQALAPVPVSECLRNVKTDMKAVSKAEATFTDGSNGLPELDESLSYLPGRGEKAMKLIAQVMAGCGQISLS
jgi:hypothetical protein